MTESFEVQRLVGSVHAVSDDTESEMHRLDYLVDRLVASAAPAVTFTSLAEACVPLLGPRCIVDLVEDSGVAYSIERPRGSMSRLPGERGWADRCTVSAAATIPSSTLAAAGGSGYYAQVSSFCPVDRTPTEEREYLLQHLVDSAVELVRRERIQAALDAEHAVSAQLRQALQGSRDIGMAIGITMNASHLTSDQAVEVLSRASQDTNRKLRDIAAELVRTGVLPHVASAPGLAVHAAGSDYQ